MIQNPQLVRYRVSEALQFANDVLSLCMLKLDEKTLALLPIGQLKKACDSLDANYKNEQGSRLSVDILQLDQTRDLYIAGIRITLDGLTYHFDAAYAAAAQRLLQSIDKYGVNIARFNYQSETSTIKSLCEDWKNDATLAAALQTLNLATWTEELRKINEQFNNLYLNRVQEKSAKVTVTYNESRQQLTESLRQLFQYIEAHALLGSDVAMPSLITELNNLISRYNQTVAMRKSTSKAKERTTETETA